MWKRAVLISALIGVVGLAMACAAELTPEEARQARKATLGYTTPIPTRLPGATPITTGADVEVWRFCSAVIAGNLNPSQLRGVDGMDITELSKDRDHSRKVVYLARELVRSSRTTTKTDWSVIERLHSACQDWRLADAQRAGWGN